MEQVQHYTSVDKRKRLEPGVAGEMYKPFYSVDKALGSEDFLIWGGGGGGGGESEQLQLQS